MPIYINYLKETTVPWLEKNLEINVPLSLGEALDQLGRNLSKIAPKLIGPATTILSRVFGGTFSFFSILIATFMFPLFLFFLLKDFPKIVEAVNGLIPLRNRTGLAQLGKEVDLSLSAFLHGQFTVMLVLAALYSIGYSIVGVPVAIGLGLLTGVLCFIPYVGAATGFILALLLALLDLKGFSSVAGVVCVFAAVQLLDATIITPKILGGKLGLRPLWIIIALMAGGELFGFLGVLLAVPTTAVLKVVISHTLYRYKNSNLYLSESAQDGCLAQADAVQTTGEEKSSGACASTPGGGQSEICSVEEK
jgi:predicted PurR-regulated permease PerM